MTRTTTMTTNEATFDQIKFTDADVVNPGDYIPKGEYNPHNIHPYLLHDHGVTLAVVFASCLQDAFDEAADADKLDRYMIGAKEFDDYVDEKGNEEGVTYLGNGGEPFDIEGLGAIELPNPPFSFVALFKARQI
jgi:hypothetical protein